MQFYTLIWLNLFNLHSVLCLLCYNGTLSYKDYGEDPLTKQLLFSTRRDVARVRCSLTVKCHDNSMCFVRAWSARARHAWIVQRGCYYLAPQDPFLQEMLTPTRAMTCKEERLPDAEYKVCLCAANWCNSAASIFNKNLQYASSWLGICISLSIISYLLRL